MEDILREPVELIDSDLDEVAGGGVFSQNGTAVALAQEQINIGQIGVDAVASAISIG